MQSDEGSGPHFLVRVRQAGPEAFTWEILRDSVPIAHSPRRLGTRVEAILDSASAAAALIGAEIEFSMEGDGSIG
jgi:hypothetical protein